jgi:hypothetical protein
MKLSRTTLNLLSALNDSQADYILDQWNTIALESYSKGLNRQTKPKTYISAHSYNGMLVVTVAHKYT